MTLKTGCFCLQELSVLTIRKIGQKFLHSYRILESVLKTIFKNRRISSKILNMNIGIYKEKFQNILEEF